MKATHILIHHTVSDQYKTTVKDVNNWHKARGFTLSKRGFYVGYHFLFTAKGFIQTRDENEVGCHCLGGWNYNSIGMCFTGNFEVDQKLTSQQESNFVDQVIKVMEGNNIPLENILLHRDCWATACPGKYIDIKYIRNLIINHNKKMDLKENELYVKVEGKKQEYGILVGGKFLTDNSLDILWTGLARNDGNLADKIHSITEAKWSEIQPKYNLKKELIK